jgi:hypothetical protein
VNLQLARDKVSFGCGKLKIWVTLLDVKLVVARLSLTSELPSTIKELALFPLN